MAQINTYSPDGRERVGIHYERDRHVMLGVQRAEERPVMIAGAQSADDAGKPRTQFEFPEVEGGLWMNLDRAGINNLIRSLREARDKAFGRDE